MALQNRSLKPYPPADVQIEDTSSASATTYIDDNFNDNVTDTAKWDVTYHTTPNAGVTVQETGGQLVITPISSTATPSYNGYQSDADYDLTGKFIQIELVQKTSNTTGVDVRFGLHIDANNYLQFIATATQLQFRYRLAGVNNTTFVTYSGTDHRWLRLRESGGDIFWDTSPDGSTWTNRRTLANPFAVTSLKVHIAAGTASSVASPGTAIFDNFSTDIVESSGSAGGQVAVSWKNRNRLTSGIKKQTDATDTPETNQTTTIRIYGQDGVTLLHTESGLTGTSYDYTAAQELTDTGLSVLQTSLTIKIKSERDGYESAEQTFVVTR